MILEVIGYYEVTDSKAGKELKETAMLLYKYFENNTPDTKLIESFRKLTEVIQSVANNSYYNTIIITDENKCLILTLNYKYDGLLYVPKTLFRENEKIYIELLEVTK